jgi:hypothetical protein
VTDDVGVNIGKPVQHAIFGRVKVLRGGHRRGFIFHTAVASPTSLIKNYANEVQWVPFEINLDTLTRPLINSTMGQQLILECSADMLTPSAAITRLQAAAVDTNIVSAVAVRTSDGVSNPSLLIKDAGSSSASKAVVIQTQVLGHVIAETGDKAASAPKKRIRIEKDAQAEEANMEQEVEAMKVDKSSEEINGAAVFGDILYTNHLFDVKIVKAGTGNQTRQYK